MTHVHFLTLVLLKAAVGSESEAAAPQCELSLLQTDLRIEKAHSDEHVKGHTILDLFDKARELHASKRHAHSETDHQDATAIVEATGAAGGADLSDGATDGVLLNTGRTKAVDQKWPDTTAVLLTQNMNAVLQARNEVKASNTARALAFVKVKMGDSALAIGAALLIVLSLCIGLAVLGSGKPSGEETGDKSNKDAARPLRPGVMSDVSVPSRNVFTPAASQLPTQQSLLRSANAVPPIQQMPGPGANEPVRLNSGRDELPPVCPSLILPHTEARFMIQMASLQGASAGNIDILGTSGRKLLHSLVCDSPDGRRCLMLASCGCEDDPRVCVFTPQRGEASQAFEVFGKGGKFYGWLEFSGRNQSVLSYAAEGASQRKVLQIEIGSQQDLRMSASAMDGRLLASAGRNVGVGGKQFEGVDSWKMQVKPGVDAVLITSCMLALILLRPLPTDDRLSTLSMGASTALGTGASLRPMGAR